MFGQLLAQQVASNSSIDLANGIESVPSPDIEIYSNRDIVIETKKKVLEEAKKYWADNIVEVDGLKLSQGNVRVTASQKSQNKWKNKSIFLGKNKEIINAGLQVIMISLEIAGKIILDGYQTTSITIFNDSIEVLNIFGRSNPCASFYLKDTIFQKALNLTRKNHFITI